MFLINNSDLRGADWRFVEHLCQARGIRWEFHSGLPRNRIERAVPRPNLARYRAAISAARSAASTPDAVLVSHMPRMAAATNSVRRVLCPHVPQIAFTFTFTELPEGRDRGRLRRALRGVQEFVVFSEYERQLYANHFDQPVERMHHLPWAMEPPRPGPVNPVGEPGTYLCAAGGEGRDYRLLAEAMRARPSDRMVIIARPHSVEGISLPDNITLLMNRPWPEFWRIVADSAGLIIPLRSETATCGRMTMVGAQLLGVPIAVTRSVWMAEYVPSSEFAHLLPAGDRLAMVEAIGALIGDLEGRSAMADRARAFAESRSRLEYWADYFRALPRRLGSASGERDYAIR